MALGEDIHGRGGVKLMRARLLGAMIVAGVLVLILIIRLYTLQVVRGEEYASKGQKNFVQHITVPHDRGIIYDRYGRILVDNRPSLDVQVTPAFLGTATQASATLERLNNTIGLSIDDLDKLVLTIKTTGGLDRFQPIIVARDLTPEQIEAIEADRSIFLLDGVAIVEGRRRLYRQATVASHLLGYVNEIDAVALDAERARGNPRNYVLGDLIGRDGVEKTYEADLRGVDGYEKTVVDAKGRAQRDEYVAALLGEQRRVDPVPGNNVYLTIDLDLQKRAEKAFAANGRAGAVVAMDVHTGAVLALASLPAFDPNRVSGTMAKQEKQTLDDDELKPWINRAISGQYAPGSTFKPIVAIAALIDRATTSHDRVRCPGYFQLGRGIWRCHIDRGHGIMVLRDAIKYSCDVFFYTMGGRLGLDAMAAFARAFGLGQRTGIALQGEKPGLVPDEAYHNQVDAATGGYQRGMAINTAIGQGALLVTPLQLAVAYAAIANGGTLSTPQLLDRIETADFRVRRRFLAESAESLSTSVGLEPTGPLAEMLATAPIDPVRITEQVEGEGPRVLSTLTPEQRRVAALTAEALGPVHEGLMAVVAEPGGTAYWHRSAHVTMAGKTGTSQVIHLGHDRLKVEETDYFERDHALFVGYAPAHDPEIVVVAVNEHAGHGSSAAAPVVTDVIDAYFELKAGRAGARP